MKQQATAPKCLSTHRPSVIDLQALVRGLPVHPIWQVLWPCHNRKKIVPDAEHLGIQLAE